MSGISLSYFGSTDYWPVIRDSSGAGFDETTARGLQIGEELLLPKSLFSENGQKLSGQTEKISGEDLNDATDGPGKYRDTAATTKETDFDKEGSDTEEGSDSDKEDSNTNGVNTSLSRSLPVDSGLKPLQGSQFPIGRTVVTVFDSSLSGTLTVETMPSDNGTSITVSTDLADIVDINEAREELDNIFTVDFEKQVLDWLTVAVEDNGEKFSVGAEIAKTSDGHIISMEVGKSILQNMWDVSLSTKKDVELDDGTKATIDAEYEVKLAASRKDYIPPRGPVATEPVPVVDRIPVFPPVIPKAPGLNTFPRDQVAKNNPNTWVPRPEPGKVLTQIPGLDLEFESPKSVSSGAFSETPQLNSDPISSISTPEWENRFLDSPIGEASTAYLEASTNVAAAVGPWESSEEVPDWATVGVATAGVTAAVAAAAVGTGAVVGAGASGAGASGAGASGAGASGAGAIGKGILSLGSKFAFF
ncbi:MAG: hypothetical protein HLUCCA11_23655 [Phormidesmis priestleyi Ana]|uniref:Uncharacterized protein n=1 Tax=Phormidesmis priestleyi Ana TaxID=1666911 RepID=A0A0P7Z9T0_9CYAN|nr:MAG: hypothetical protein HLUCCA11_23655 [Phormidesmis priestleyi Ana]